MCNARCSVVPLSVARLTSNPPLTAHFSSFWRPSGSILWPRFYGHVALVALEHTTSLVFPCNTVVLFGCLLCGFSAHPLTTGAYQASSILQSPPRGSATQRSLHLQCLVFRPRLPVFCTVVPKPLRCGRLELLLLVCLVVAARWCTTPLSWRPWLSVAAEPRVCVVVELLDVLRTSLSIVLYSWWQSI